VKIPRKVYGLMRILPGGLVEETRLFFGMIAEQGILF